MARRTTAQARSRLPVIASAATARRRKASCLLSGAAARTARAASTSPRRNSAAARSAGRLIPGASGPCGAAAGDNNRRRSRDCSAATVVSGRWPSRSSARARAVPCQKSGGNACSGGATSPLHPEGGEGRGSLAIGGAGDNGGAGASGGGGSGGSSGIGGPGCWAKARAGSKHARAANPRAASRYGPSPGKAGIRDNLLDRRGGGRRVPHGQKNAAAQDQQNDEQNEPDGELSHIAIRPLSHLLEDQPRLTTDPHDMLVPLGHVWRKSDEGAGDPGGRADRRTAAAKGRYAGLCAASDDRARRADGSRQNQDRPSLGGAPQSAVLRFGHGDRDCRRREHRGDFANRVEHAFREGERRVIARLLAQPVHVLATGGGAFMDLQTRTLIARRGVSLWLRADLDILVARVSRRSNRPLLKRGDPREILAALIDTRHPVYATADLVVDSGEGAPEATVRRALAALAACPLTYAPPVEESTL